MWNTCAPERFDMYVHEEANEPDSPVVVQSMLYQYALDTQWGTSGTVYQARRGWNEGRVFYLTI